MIRIRKAATRGSMRNHWLDARFTFSFADYRDKAWDGYSDLIVLNDDRVAPGGGFRPHGHQDIEAISYVLAGEVEHRDSLGNVARMRAGDVQRMTAGTGITHSEMNASAVSPEHHLQFWIRPAVAGLAPGYEQRSFADDEKRDNLRLIVSPDGQAGSITVHQDVNVFASRVGMVSLRYAPRPGRRTFLHVATGRITLDGVALEEGDGVAIEDEPLINFVGAPDGEVLIFDLR